MSGQEKPSPEIAVIGDAYLEMSNVVVKFIMGLTQNNPVLLHAVAATVEARLRALNHYNLVANIIAADKEPEKP